MKILQPVAMCSYFHNKSDFESDMVVGADGLV